VEELRKANLIITSKHQNNLVYKFTEHFFALLEIVPCKSKNWTKQSTKTGLSCHEQKREQINNRKILNFQKEPVTINSETTKVLLGKIESDKQNKKSPYDDKACAIQWINSLNENDLRHSFISERVNKVRQLWGL